MFRSPFVVCAAVAWLSAFGLSDAATLSVKGGSGTGGGTIVRGGTGDASNTDASAKGDTDTLAELGYTAATLASDLASLELVVTVSNTSGFAADAALIQSLELFFTSSTPCSLSVATDCAAVSTIRQGFGGLKYDTGPDVGQNVDLTAETVVASVQFAASPGIGVAFDTPQTFSLKDAQAADIAALLLAAFPQGFPGSPYSSDPNFLNLMFLGFSVQSIGVLFDSTTSSGFVEVTDGNETHIFAAAPVDTDIATVPEPGSLLLLGIGCLSIAAVHRRRAGRRSER
jgi:hypothetical protein